MYYTTQFVAAKWYMRHAVLTTKFQRQLTEEPHLLSCIGSNICLYGSMYVSRGGRSNMPYANSFPLPCHFQGGGVRFWFWFWLASSPWSLALV